MSESIRIVGDTLKGTHPFSTLGSFISNDGTALGFVDSGLNNELGEKIYNRLIVHLKSFILDLYTQKREFLWHPNDLTKNQVCEALETEFKEALNQVITDTEQTGGHIPPQLKLFFCLGAGETIFAIKYGQIQMSLLKPSGFLPLRELKPVKINQHLPTFAESTVIKLKETDRVLFSCGSALTAITQTPIKTPNSQDYRLISDHIKKVRDSSRDHQGALYLVGIDHTYKVALERGFADVADALSQSTLFKDLDSEEIASLLLISNKRIIQPQEIISEEGSEGVSILVLVSGAISVLIKEKEHIVRKNPGEFFGESGFLEGLPRSGSLIAKTAVILLEMMNDHLWDLIRNKPSLGVKILTRIASNAARKRREANARFNLKLNTQTQTHLLDQMNPSDTRHWVQACSKALKNSQLFRSMNPDEIAFIVGSSYPREFPSGTVLLKAGSPSEKIYLGLNGTISLSSESGVPENLAIFGETLGAVEWMDQLPVEKSVHALTDVITLEIPHTILSDLISAHPRIGTKILWAIGRMVSKKLHKRSTTASNSK